VLFGLSLPDGGECGDPTFVVELGRLAEESGWDGVFLEDYVCYQGDRAAPTCDAWTALAALAPLTSRVRLGTMVTPLTRRRPWNVARQVAAVDALSGGRAVLGVGLGDTGESVGVDASFTAFGEELDARSRGSMLDEALEIVAGLWTGEPFSFDGAHYRVDEVTALPVPPQRPGPPIWVGGGYPSRRPVERALRWDGSCLYRRADGDEFVRMSPDDVRDLRARAGDRPWTIAVGGSGRGQDAEAEREHIRSVAEAGADWWVEWVPPASRDAMRTAVARGPLA
jgi:alkanesulfonate monooxygenase SsuD/methylene tetrahydromethanopterin reductase-like flavin-dependent oxidoreductase (luciferase family)